MVDAICASPSFDLTPENFVASGTGEFLKQYALQQRSTPIFTASGILGSLVVTHLGDPNLSCGINTPHRCAPSCSSVVRKLQDNFDEARAVYFTFVSAQHLAETLKTLSSGLLAGQLNVAQMSGPMSESLFKPGDTRSSPWVGYAMKLTAFALRQVAGFIPTAVASDAIQQALRDRIDADKVRTQYWGVALKEFQSGIRNERMHVAHKNADHNKGKTKSIEAGLKAAGKRVELMQKKLREMLHTMAHMKGISSAKKAEYLSVGLTALLNHWSVKLEMGVFSKGSAASVGQSKVWLESWIMRTVEAARTSLVETADDIISCNTVQSDGSTLLSDITYWGTFLPASREGEVGYYHSGQMEALMFPFSGFELY